MPFHLITQHNPQDRALHLREAGRGYHGHVAYVDAALQVRIQTTFASFWQERLVSLKNPETPIVRDLLLRPRLFLQSGLRIENEPLPPTNPSRLEAACHYFDISDALLSRSVSSLSNGELRRILVARAYMETPEALILDDPLGGLDPGHRTSMVQALREIAINGTDVWLGLPAEKEEETTHSSAKGVQQLRVPGEKTGEELVKLEKISVRFGDALILQNINWTIRVGERWLLMGPNGSGKSTLLAFLTADHPQIYRNRVCLFGQTPGHGLSIWEHRRFIGFCSPELHHQWKENLSLWQLVTEGCNVGRGETGPILWEERRYAEHLLQSVGLNGETHFLSASYPEQRLALVLRAMVRKPRLLVLDEPDQGLDPDWRTRLWNLLDVEVQGGNNALVIASHHAQSIPRCITHTFTL
ncbi:MAG TPA: ATP-binding cassette domain-containing protein [Fibrobacteraceae bacterium]|nr:ATP-binding cassette domain-containing protein [Fibrobacteraceae bacterium]